MTRILIILTVAVLWAQPSFADIPRFLKASNGLYRGGQPETAADYARLKMLGIKTIINLRAGDDYLKERARAKPFGLKVIGAPMAAYRTPDDDQIKHVLEAMSDETKKPVFVHCLQGKDRTGLLLGLHRITAQKWSKEEAYEEMIQLGFNPLYVPLKRYFWSYGENHSLRYLDFVSSQ
jgi:protein tyrosine phosphatase (PTP) superfamily phosphohydrolase (DUF442 family)